MGLLGDIVGEIASTALNNYLSEDKSSNGYNITIVMPIDSFYQSNAWTNVELRNLRLKGLISYSALILNVKPIVDRTVSVNISEADGCIDNYIVTNGDLCIYYGMFNGNAAVTISGKDKSSVEDAFYAIHKMISSFADAQVVEDELPPYKNANWLDLKKTLLIQSCYMNNISSQITEEAADEEDDDGKKFEKLLDKWIEIFQKKDLIENPCFSDSTDEYYEIVSFFGLEDEDSEKPLKSYKLQDGSTISCYVGHNKQLLLRQSSEFDTVVHKDSVRSEFDTFMFKYVSATGNGCLYFYFLPDTSNISYESQITCKLYLGFKNDRSELAAYKGFYVEIPTILTLNEDDDIDSFCDAAFEGKNKFGGFKGFLRRIGKKDLFKTIIDFVNTLTEIDLRSYSDTELEIVDKVLKYTHVYGECDGNFFKLLDKWDSVFTKYDWTECPKFGKEGNRLIIEKENSLFVIIFDEENEGVRIIYHPDKHVETTYLEFSDFVYYKSFLVLRFVSEDSKIARTVNIKSFYCRKDRKEEIPEPLNTDTLLAILHKYSVFEHFKTFFDSISEKMEEAGQKAQKEQENALRREEEKRAEEKKKLEDNALSALDNF